MLIDMTIDDRRTKEIELLSAQSFMALVDIAQAIGVSASTVRRDLETLERQGIVRRTHGGAIYIGDGIHRAGAGPQMTAAAEKQAIARAVAELIAPGQTLMLNGGTTCWQIARAIQGRRLNVVTNSVGVASVLCDDPSAEVTLVGGYVYPRIGVAVGAMAERQIDSLHASRLVTSCAGLTADGPFEPNQMMADIERRMMAKCDEVILAADHGKLGLRSVVKMCEWSEVDVIVTDAGADEAARAWLNALGVKVIFAELSASLRDGG